MELICLIRKNPVFINPDHIVSIQPDKNNPEDYVMFMDDKSTFTMKKDVAIQLTEHITRHFIRVQGVE